MSMHPIQQQILLRTKAVPLAAPQPATSEEVLMPAECGPTSYNLPVKDIPAQAIPETGSELALAFLQSIR